MAKRRPGAAIVLADPLFVREAHNIVRIAAERLDSVTGQLAKRGEKAVIPRLGERMRCEQDCGEQQP